MLVCRHPTLDFGGGSVGRKNILFWWFMKIFVHGRVNIFLFEKFDFYELESNEETGEESYGEILKLESREQSYRGK